MTEAEAKRVLVAHVEAERSSMLAQAIRVTLEAQASEQRVYARIEQRLHELLKRFERAGITASESCVPDPGILEDNLVALGIELGA